jgi:predicted DNA-binding transcriptional regulator AlpA
MPMTHQNNQNKSEPIPAVRMIPKAEVLRIAGGVSYVAIWTWMQLGTFPRARKVGGQTMWLSTDIDAWLANLPLRRIKGDGPPVGGMPKGFVEGANPRARRSNKVAA